MDTTSDTPTASHKPRSLKKLLFLSLAALGVVYGDIGTSPLYAVNEIFFGHRVVQHAPEAILGGIGLVVWALTIVICLKYVIIVLRADNDGEGGVFALSNLIRQAAGHKTPYVTLVSALLVFGAGLLIGDGMITPAISVISAVEGLKVATAAFEPYVVPIAILVLTGLFAIQRQGTTKVGGVFGPVILLWFLAIGSIGFSSLVREPRILLALNPIYIIRFIASIHLIDVFRVLGSVLLVVTGGEAMFADLGHFGKRPIRLSWFSVVYPMLLLNYFGQGAYLLSGQPVMFGNVFYSMVPAWALLPMVFLATFAAIIASQAMISGAFSLVTQATALNYLPRLKIVQTHHEHEGQRYVPMVNWGLYLGTVILVLWFQTSSRLASAYGLAVAGDMLITSLALVIVAKRLWRWPTLKIVATIGAFLVIDVMLFLSSSLKLPEGGFIPLVVAFVGLFVMKTWEWGRKHVEHTLAHYPTMKLRELVELKKRAKESLPRAVIIMTPIAIENLDDHVPVLEQMFVERYGLLSKHIIFLTVKSRRAPHMNRDRYHITKFLEDREKGSIMAVKVNFGFMEDPNVEATLEGLARHHEVNISEHPNRWLVHVLEDRIVPSRTLSGITVMLIRFFQLMHRNAVSAVDYFNLGDRVRLSSEVLPVRVKK